MQKLSYLGNVWVQVEARLHDKDAMLVSLQQAAQIAQKQQAEDRASLIAGNTRQGQLEGQVLALSRYVHIDCVTQLGLDLSGSWMTQVHATCP